MEEKKDQCGKKNPSYKKREKGETEKTELCEFGKG